MTTLYGQPAHSLQLSVWWYLTQAWVSRLVIERLHYPETVIKYIRN
jgi:hypothetical protein